MSIVDAVFENGVFRPLAPVPLANGTRVSLQVRTQRQSMTPQEVARVMTEIAAKTPATPEPDNAARDHDRILYGPSGAR